MIIPKLTYVTVAWWNIMNIALGRSERERLQRAACTMITAMRTTPTKVLEMLLDLPTLRKVVDSIVLIAAFRLPRPDPRNIEIGYTRIWAKANKVDSKFSKIKDKVTLRRTSGKYRIVILTRKK